jgi:hypothetical protein
MVVAFGNLIDIIVIAAQSEDPNAGLSQASFTANVNSQEITDLNPSFTQIFRQENSSCLPVLWR